MRSGRLAGIGLVALLAVSLQAQTIPPQQLAVLQAEDRRAPTPADVSRIQVQVRSRTIQTAIVALRALGRLERPALIPSITPALGHRWPEVRAEAANAVAQAAQGWTKGLTAPGSMVPASVLNTLAARLRIEEEPNVRAAIAQSIGRLPYRTPASVQQAERALLDLLARSDLVPDRLGVAKGFESLLRSNDGHEPSADAVRALRLLAGGPAADGTGTTAGGRAPASSADALRDPRVRRLALQALITAGAVDAPLIERAARDIDAQVRRLAIGAASASGLAPDRLAAGIDDGAPIVRLEALRGLHARKDQRACPLTIAMTSDPDPRVALEAIGELRACNTSSDAVDLLDRFAGEMRDAYRQWHHAAHALVSLAAVAPDRARERLGRFTGASTWQLRLYAARAAAVLDDRSTLQRLAQDAHDNVVEAALFGLVTGAGHEADAIYVAALGRPTYQVVRAAALALDGSTHPGATAALETARQRLAGDLSAGALDAYAAIVDTLAGLGARPPARPAGRAKANASLTTANLRRLSAPRARVIVRNVGTFEVALGVSEAPGTVTRFVELAEAGYYDGSTFHRVIPDVAIHGGSPDANEYAGHPDLMRDEVGLWPHVRGAVGLSSRGRDAGDGRLFIDVVDNPRFDHEFTVFGQVVNGLDVVDRLLEGDEIERVEIIP